MEDLVWFYDSLVYSEGFWVWMELRVSSVQFQRYRKLKIVYEEAVEEVCRESQ